MKALYFECASGISGDMSVAALLDLGSDQKVLMDALNSIPIDGFSVEISRVKKNGIDCCDFNVKLQKPNHDHDMHYLFDTNSDQNEYQHTDHDHQHNTEHHSEHAAHHHHGRGLSEITQIIKQTKMEEPARNLAIKIFDIIAAAESKAHGIPKDEVHFHEVGAVDSIVDVIAFSVCFTNLGINKVYIPRIFEGSGTIRCQHGLLPVPVPAVLNIANEHKLNLNLSSEKGEFITPTGAAFAAAITTDFSMPQNYKITKVGQGAGKRSYNIPSILRVMELELSDLESDTIIKIETNIDDCTGENLGFVMEELLKNGAKDVYYIPCFMKKNRPAYVLNVICTQAQLPVLENIIFTHTTTIGLRKTVMERTVLPREIIEVSTKLGKASVKVVTINGQKRFYPEYESISQIIKQTNLSFLEIYNIILSSINL